MIFYSKTGGGHLRSAEAIAKKIVEFDPKTEVVMVDGLEETSFRLKINPAAGYLFISTRLLLIFNALFSLSNNNKGLMLLRGYLRLFWGKNFANIIKLQRPDLILSTHHFITPSTISGGVNVPYFVVVTDLGLPHRIWFDEKSDKTIVPTKEMQDYYQKFSQDKSKVEVLGYPIKDEFANYKHQRKETNQILFLGGGLEVKLAKSYLDQLLKDFPDKKIVVVCGQNQALLKALDNSKATVLGFVDNMYELMKNSDIVITKAGPAVVLEAAILKKPQIITKYVGLQEKDNLDFVVSNKLGVYCPNPAKISQEIKNIYKNYEDFQHQFELDTKGAEKIARFLLSF